MEMLIYWAANDGFPDPAHRPSNWHNDTAAGFFRTSIVEVPDAQSYVFRLPSKPTRTWTYAVWTLTYVDTKKVSKFGLHMNIRPCDSRVKRRFQKNKSRSPGLADGNKSTTKYQLLKLALSLFYFVHTAGLPERKGTRWIKST